MKDGKGKPITNTDITAYSYTSKFKSHGMPNLPVYSNVIKANSGAITDYSSLFQNRKVKKKSTINSTWISRLGLDSIEYYKFLLPEYYYQYNVPTADSSTMVVPYVVVDGEIKNSYLIWIDNILHYFANSDQQEVYSFNVNDGLHNIRFRLNDRIVELVNVPIKKGHRNYFSFNGALDSFQVKESPLKATLKMRREMMDKNRINQLDKDELYKLSKELIQIDPNYQYLQLPNKSTLFHYPVYLETSKTNYYINPPKLNYRGYNFNSDNVTIGPFPQRSTVPKVGNIAAIYNRDSLNHYLPINGNTAYSLYENSMHSKELSSNHYINNRFNSNRELSLFDQALSKKAIDSIFTHGIEENLRQMSGIALPNNKTIKNYNDYLKLELNKDSEGLAFNPILILSIPKGNHDTIDIKDYLLMYGETRTINNLSPGEYEFIFIMNDSLSYSHEVEIKRGRSEERRVGKEGRL